jgi:hypothetical protein
MACDRRQLLVQERGLKQVVGLQRCRHGLEQETAVGVEQGHQGGSREATAHGLLAGLTERLLQFRSIRHREAGAVQQVHPVAMPAGVGVVVLEAGAGNRPLQAAKEGHGETLTGLAVSGVGEVEFGEVAEVTAGRVAMQDLLQEERGGDQRGKGALSAGQVKVVADTLDEALGDDLSEVGFEMLDGLGDTEHKGLPWPP